jgi:dihydroorotate dehydrogenase
MFADLASFFTVNVSSPNTPGLRDLQGEGALDDLMARVLDARDAATEKHGRKVPVLLKIAPDVTEPDLDSFARVIEARNPDGLVATNTTLSRAGVSDPSVVGEAGGLSGAPLFERATIVLAKMRQRLEPSMPIIGVGGIGSGDQAYEKIRAGASLVELYTGLIYGGFELVTDMQRDLSRRLRADGYASISQAVGTTSENWAEKPLPDQA